VFVRLPLFLIFFRKVGGQEMSAEVHVLTHSHVAEERNFFIFVWKWGM